MGRTLIQHIHNPKGRTCFCGPACWCQRAAVGRAVKWWFPARWFGIEHKQRAQVEMMTTTHRADWKRRADR